MSERIGAKPGDEIVFSSTMKLAVENGDGGSKRVCGLGAPYGVQQTLWSGRYFTEKVEFMPGCFTESLAGGDPIISSFNHDHNYLLGSTKNSTLRLTDTAEGLRFEVEIDSEDPEAARVYRLVERGAVGGSSVDIKINEVEEKVTRDGDHETLLQRFKRVTLREVGPVARPAFRDSTAEARCSRRDAAASYAAFLETIRGENGEYAELIGGLGR